MRRTIAWLAVSTVLLTIARAGGAGEVYLLARDCSARSPNVKVADPRWDGLMVCYGPRGFVEWTLEVEKAGRYYVGWLLASGESRPVALCVNGKRLPGQFLGQPTGGFFALNLRWTTTGPFEFCLLYTSPSPRD